MKLGAFDASDGANAPIRPKASPRSTPSHSLCSSFSFCERAESTVPSSEEGSPIRGRTLVRVPAHERSEHRAMTRLQTGPNVQDVDSSTMQRLLSRGLTNEPEDIDGYYIEPLPSERIRYSLSEEIHKAVTFNGSIDLTNFGGHRDTFALLGLRRVQISGPELPATFFRRLLHYVNFEEYLSLRLSCRFWSASVTLTRPLVMPAFYKLPAGVLEEMGTCLSPVDFNAARHTCRAWMICSLEDGLITRALKDGGWWRAAEADMDLHRELKGHRTSDSINEQWLLSKRLATECSLLPSWTGNGLSSKLCSSPDRQSNHTGVTLTSKTDFLELTAGYNPRRGNPQQESVVRFTVSVCHRFVLITEGRLIYVYSLQHDGSSISHIYGGKLSRVTTVICPHRVLAVSMDTSSQRFAMAALLEGRVGLVCDLQQDTPPSSSSQKRSTPQVSSSVAPDCRASISSSVSPTELLVGGVNPPHDYATFQASPSEYAFTRAIAEASLPDLHSARDIREFGEMADPTLSPEHDSYPNSLPNAGYIPLEEASRSIYHNLCYAKDLPRSVAICPQRRCVAFGCSVGIELHWIDALTGQNLTRWFPLTAPSDFLYFFSPRSGADSGKKLRLLSSASHPKVTSPRTSVTRNCGEQNLSGLSATDYTWRVSGRYDHYRAVPISDGWSVLFTDPVEGNLCLGEDAPRGAGLTELTRRFVFKGPSELGAAVLPKVYGAGRELRWGIRVAVGYGEAIWLFVVPPALFFRDASAVEEPIRIEGVKIGEMQGLVDLAVDSSGGDLTIWSFAVDGMAYVWQIAGGQRRVLERSVLENGTVTARKKTSNTSPAAVHFDGATRLHPFLKPSIQTPLLGLHESIIDHDGDTVMPDASAQEDKGYTSASADDDDGDTIMPDASALEDEGYASGADDDDGNEFAQAGGAFAIHAPPLRGSWSEGDADWVPGYLARVGGEIEDEGLGVDVFVLTRAEVEVLAS